MPKDVQNAKNDNKIARKRVMQSGRSSTKTEKKGDWLTGVPLDPNIPMCLEPALVARLRVLPHTHATSGAVALNLSLIAKSLTTAISKHPGVAVATCADDVLADLAKSFEAFDALQGFGIPSALLQNGSAALRALVAVLPIISSDQVRRASLPRALGIAIRVLEKSTLPENRALSSFYGDMLSLVLREKDGGVIIAQRQDSPVMTAPDGSTLVEDAVSRGEASSVKEVLDGLRVIRRTAGQAAKKFNIVLTDSAVLVLVSELRRIARLDTLAELESTDVTLAKSVLDLAMHDRNMFPSSSVTENDFLSALGALGNTGKMCHLRDGLGGLALRALSGWSKNKAANASFARKAATELDLAVQFCMEAEFDLMGSSDLPDWCAIEVEDSILEEYTETLADFVSVVDSASSVDDALQRKLGIVVERLAVVEDRLTDDQIQQNRCLWEGLVAFGFAPRGRIPPDNRNLVDASLVAKKMACRWAGKHDFRL